MDINDKDFEMLKLVYKTLDDKFAEDIVIKDVRKGAMFADYFVIASASSLSQVKAISNHIEQELQRNGGKLKHKEGYNTSRWVLLDFTSIIVHIFYKEDREYYSLDDFWEDSPDIDLAVFS